MNMKKIVYITILFSCVLAHTRDASNSITANQETTDKPSFFEKTKEKLGNFGRHLLDIPKYIFGRWVNRGKTAEENLAVSVDENQIEQKKSNSSSLRSYKNGIKEDSDEEQFARETTDEQMYENNSNIRNDNKNLKSKINLQHNDDQDLIQTKSVFRNDLTNVNEHSDNNLVTSNISSTTNEEKTQNKNTQASVPSVIWKENDDFLNELKQNNASQETTDKSSFLEKTKEQLGNFSRHLLDIPKYIFGRWVNRGKTAEENLAVSVDENQIEQKKSNSSSLRSYKNGIKEDSDDEQFARETTDEQINENNSNFRNDNKNLKSKINLQHNVHQDLIQTKSVFRNDLTNINEHSDNNLVTSNISSTTNEEKTQNKNTQASVPSVTWKENVDFLNELKQNKIKRPFATLNSYPLYKYQKTINPDLNFYPDFFDARIAFPYCYDIIDTIADQSACGASWASAAASVMSDRRCIASKGLLRTPVSAEDLMSCCAPCGFGCVAGLVDEAFNWWATHGIVTGGRYNSNSGCKPYTLPMCSHYINTGYTNCSAMNDLRTPECVKKCNNTSDLDYESELTFGRTGVMWFNSVEDIQKEILSNGPVTANFDVYGDFITYTSGVYRHVTGPKLGVHTARIIGWGTDFESGTPYWIMANSWNENWGENGFFKIVRGKNECGVESEVFAALPKL
ncbi:unnamed protein product [Phyllotreta striolata]|uniref:Peptidase C1A papain C-terminal domain-containing protein n=1 Tax=Phyllotreta striolata TaxID=444603 RepID=A0A9N9XLA2_PHYSR|nr:unnamed protein product [Phyllotreta striolata]